ncbi:MAG: Amidase [Pseudonocardiales bacterium]|nr:Amidase [Pseudonocardiales bacterium]
MDATDLAYLPVTELAPLIETGEISPVDLVEAQLARIDKLDGVLRAYICVDSDRAWAQAKAAEAEIAAGGYRGPLHGITVAHKDIIDVRGVPTTGASKIFKDAPPAAGDATVQARLRAAGAICLGKLNLVEFASGSMGVFGYARNPHNLAASPGGSSSGSGVAAAAGLATIVTGTDTGGSVRNPSCFTGLAGLRPTYGRVSRYGCIPLSWSQDSIGPMGRRVKDIALMLGAMSGSDRFDATAANRTVPDFTDGMDAGLAGVRIGVPTSFFFDDLHPEVDAAMTAAIAKMAELGAEIKPIELPVSQYAAAASWIIAYSESFVYHERLFKERAHDYTPAFYLKITAAGLTSSVERVTSQRIRQAVTRELMTALEGVDVIVTPSNRGLASTRGDAVPAGDKKIPWTAEMGSLTRSASLAGLPAMSLPVGFAGDDTGIGLQVIGRPFDEAMIFRVGQAYEQATRWFEKLPSDDFPADLPDAFGAAPLPAPIESTAPVTTGWVMDMARQLEYPFVTQDDATRIAPMLREVKLQLRAASQALKLDLEPPTRASGSF